MAADTPKPVTRLPDGSAFVCVSMPLPRAHWIYQVGVWDTDRDSDAPVPVFGRDRVEAVRAAAKWAVRAATMNGTEMDFDPDALVQNMVYALCGPQGGSQTTQRAGLLRR